MDIIYSRTKIRIKKKYKILIVIILIIIVLNVILNKIIYPLFSSKSIYLANVLITQITNEDTEKVMHNYTYQDSEGNVTFLESNVITINKIKAEIVSQIQNRFIEKKENQTIGIKLGSLTANRLLANIGPTITIQVIPSGTISSTIETEFYSVGVNQSIHRIYLDIKCTVSILSPFDSVSQTTNNRILLSESVIVGTTPENYYNIDEVSSEEQLNFIP